MKKIRNGYVTEFISNRRYPSNAEGIYFEKRRSYEESIIQTILTIRTYYDLKEINSLKYKNKTYLRLGVSDVG